MPPRIRRRITSAKREEIEKEQEAIARSIVRPFDKLSGLPVSYSKPANYEEVLKNPLTIKDSGILYRSLMKSRNNYLTMAPPFQLYWVKQSLYSKKIQSDLALNIDRKPVLGTEINARDVMVKLTDCGLTIGPHSYEVRLFIVKDERSDPKKEEMINLQPMQGVVTPGEIEGINGIGNSIPASDQPSQINGSDQPSEVVTEATESEQPNEQITENGESQITEASDMISSDIGASETAVSETVPPSNISENDSIMADTSQINDLIPSPVPESNMEDSINEDTNQHTPEPSFPQTSNNDTTEEKKKKYDPSDLESPINQLMIDNLRAIAKIDPRLQKLIDVVGDGSHTPEQYQMFQGFVARAREMGPPPHPFLLPGFQIDPFQPIRVKRLIKELRQIRESTMFTSTFGKDQRLTAFQEKYLLDAILLFEFVDNANVRYRIPRNAIMEVLPSQNSGEERDILISFLWIHNQNELDNYNKKVKEYEDFQKAKQQKLKEEEEQKKKDEEEKLKSEEKESVEPEVKEEEQEDRSLRTRRKRAPPPKRRKAAPKAEVEPKMPTEPELRFTPVSFVLHDIPVKFVPILTNSVVKPDDARKYMSDIIEKGTRSSSFYLWYQVDGKLDEKLAENVRSELVNEEKKMTGLVYSSTGTNGPSKKRKIMNVGHPFSQHT
ncbi:hypothetical protein CLIB1444_02S09406 [[Candida] jaroonii]|uniref:Uncharacterized protein n=1 Tax=[Candida] jaroonii TaxID=467808 RepID=A0ACA9Y3E1_9ASCO|nr:hypothetical protein CLIB1444_02S09406 [[Candida] jaroonii]